MLPPGTYRINLHGYDVELVDAADIPAGFVVHRWFSMKSVERMPLPALEGYYERLSERPAYRRHIRNGLP